jgi:hypothetical protein
VSSPRVSAVKIVIKSALKIFTAIYLIVKDTIPSSLPNPINNSIHKAVANQQQMYLFTNEFYSFWKLQMMEAAWDLQSLSSRRNI